MNVLFLPPDILDFKKVENSTAFPCMSWSHLMTPQQARLGEYNFGSSFFVVNVLQSKGKSGKWKLKCLKAEIIIYVQMDISS